MTRFSIVLFSIVVLGISFYGLLTDSYYTNVLIDTSTYVVAARVALVSVLLMYAFVPRLRHRVSAALLITTAVIMVVVGFTSLGSPSLLNLTTAYILPGDSIILIEGGILALIMVAILPIGRTFDIGRPVHTKLPRFVARESTALSRQMQRQPYTASTKVRVRSFVTRNKNSSPSIDS